jgi:hypothetical protein
VSEAPSWGREGVSLTARVDFGACRDPAVRVPRPFDHVLGFPHWG